MGGFYSHLGPNYCLHEQVLFCHQTGTECGYLQQKAGRKWEKRLAVVLPGGILILYKFYIYGVSPGIPLIGRIYKLKGCRRFEIVSKGNNLLLKMMITDGKILRLKFKGDESFLSLEALVRHSSAMNKED